MENAPHVANQWPSQIIRKRYFNGRFIGFLNVDHTHTVLKPTTENNTLPNRKFTHISCIHSSWRSWYDGLYQHANKLQVPIFYGLAKVLDISWNPLRETMHSETNARFYAREHFIASTIQWTLNGVKQRDEYIFAPLYTLCWQVVNLNRWHIIIHCNPNGTFLNPFFYACTGFNVSSIFKPLCLYLYFVRVFSPQNYH